MVKLTIDGKSIEVLEGTTVLKAAEQAGIYIPTLCAHPQLTPYGGCRLCMVEVEGARILQPSCTLPVTEGMQVKTNTQKVLDARKFVLTLIFSERNHFCMYCQVTDGDCELQNAAYDESMTHWPLQPNWQPYEVDASHKYFVLDHNRCILCRRCVLACDELVGNFTLGFEERGANSFLVADYGVPLGESTCISCGTCVQICPTGALIDRQSAYQGKETEVDHHLSVCVDCSVGCQRDVLTRDNRLVRIEGDWDAPLNHGLLCEKGRFEPLVKECNRILTPLVRKDGSLKAATWDEALSVIIDKIKPLAGKKEKGLAILVSSRLSAESLALIDEVFNQGFKAALVTSIEEDQSASVAAEISEELGKPFESKLDVLKDTDVALVLGADLATDHQVAGFFLKRQQASGTKLIVAGTKENRCIDKANLKLQQTKGTSLDLIEGLTAALVKLGKSKVEDLQAADTLNSSLEKTGLAVDSFLKAAEYISGAEKPVIVYGKGFVSNNNKVALKALWEFADLIGKNGAPLIGIKGQANSMAAAQLMLIKPFKTDSVQAVYLALGDEIPTKKFTKDLEKVPFVAVHAAYSSQLTSNADVVLPAVIWAEEEGHYLNSDGRLQKNCKALEAPENVLDTVTTLQKIAELLNVKTKCDWKSQLLARVSSIEITQG
ncbi:MAG: molybdopterin-dependent oxidoreductase [Chloroflexota bacterium]